MVCCVCSLVLSSRGLLLEHLALAHLDELTRLASTHGSSSHSFLSGRQESSSKSQQDVPASRIYFPSPTSESSSRADSKQDGGSSHPRSGGSSVPSPTLSPPLSHPCSPGTPSQNNRCAPPPSTPTPPALTFSSGGMMPNSSLPSMVGGPLTPSTSNGTPDPPTPDTPYQAVGGDKDSSNDETNDLKSKRNHYMRPYKAG